MAVVTALGSDSFRRSVGADIWRIRIWALLVRVCCHALVQTGSGMRAGTQERGVYA